MCETVTWEKVSIFLRQKYGLDDGYQVMWVGRDIDKSPDDIEELAANLIFDSIDVDDLTNQIQTVNAPPNHLIYILYDTTNDRPPILGLLSSEEQKAITEATSLGSSPSLGVPNFIS